MKIENKIRPYRWEERRKEGLLAGFRALLGYWPNVLPALATTGTITMPYLQKAEYPENENEKNLTGSQLGEIGLSTPEEATSSLSASRIFRQQAS